MMMRAKTRRCFFAGLLWALSTLSSSSSFQCGRVSRKGGSHLDQVSGRRHVSPQPSASDRPHRTGDAAGVFSRRFSLETRPTVTEFDTAAPRMVGTSAEMVPRKSATTVVDAAAPAVLSSRSKQQQQQQREEPASGGVSEDVGQQDREKETTNISASRPFRPPSLRVADLAPDVDESRLVELFRAAGRIASVSVCREAATGRSHGYAYVNFYNIVHAERAVAMLDGVTINGRPCRIAWSPTPDPSLRHPSTSGRGGTLFVKNLPLSMDNEQLYDTFVPFGGIISCNVVTDRQTGLSKHYGRVQFGEAKAAMAAIAALNGTVVQGNVVQVQPYVRRHDRWTNCYVSNIPTDWDEDRLQQEFSQFGEIVSAKGVYKPWNPDDDDDDDEENDDESSHRLPLRRGFVRFAAHEHAVAAVEALNGKEYKTKVGDENGASEMMQKLYVKRGLKKMERVRERTRVYVRNLHGAVTDAMLREEFGRFGTITSARVTKDIVDGRSLGSGFVTFASFQEASRAVKERNGKLVHGKPITLSLERASIDSDVQQDDNIYVKNLDGAVTDDGLRDIFSTIGSVTSALVLKEATNGRSRGVGFVSFSTSAEAAQAIHKMNGTMIHGKKIAVTFAVRRRDVRSA